MLIIIGLFVIIIRILMNNNKYYYYNSNDHHNHNNNHNHHKAVRESVRSWARERFVGRVFGGERFHPHFFQGPKKMWLGVCLKGSTSIVSICCVHCMGKSGWGRNILLRVLSLCSASRGFQ